MGFKLKKTKARVVFRSCRLILLILALDNRPPTLIWRASTLINKLIILLCVE